MLSTGSFPRGVRIGPATGWRAWPRLSCSVEAGRSITASNSMEYAYEGDYLTGEGRPPFPEAVVEA